MSRLCVSLRSAWQRSNLSANASRCPNFEKFRPSTVRLPLAFLAILTPVSVAAQTQTILFPGQTGPELLAAIVAEYKPATVLSETNAKDRMYDTIDVTNEGGQDGVVGVYTGWFVPFDCAPSCDPSQDVFNNGAGLNMEHTWPRAFGADIGNAEWNLHHLFPTRVDVNADRANFPFDEIPDPQTTRWYREDGTQTSIPDASIIDEFSELRGGLEFEPREDHKGDVARAMFYFYTMYKSEADGSGGGPFFNAQKETLYDWATTDLISLKEYNRTLAIAPFQSNDSNPYVLDSTLVRRAFFPEIVVSTPEAPAVARLQLTVPSPQPFRTQTSFTLTLAESSPVRVEVFDALGRLVTTLLDGSISSSSPIRLVLDGASLAPGVYLVRATSHREVVTRRLVRIR